MRSRGTERCGVLCAASTAQPFNTNQCDSFCGLGTVDPRCYLCSVRS
jgi:hypothetical protein